jgi:hypothetical protein
MAHGQKGSDMEADEKCETFRAVWYRFLAMGGAEKQNAAT